MPRPVQSFAVGERVGERVVLEYLGRLQRSPSTKDQRYRVRCDCGTVYEVWRAELRASQRCARCGYIRQREDGLGREEFHLVHAERPEVAALLAEAGAAWPQLWRRTDEESNPASLHSVRKARRKAHEARHRARNKTYGWRPGENDERDEAAAADAERLALLCEVSLEAFRELAEAPCGPFSLAEIGLLLGLSRERIRQLQEAGLRHLRLRMERGFGAARVLRDYEHHEGSDACASVWELLGLDGGCGAGEGPGPGGEEAA